MTSLKKVKEGRQKAESQSTALLSAMCTWPVVSTSAELDDADSAGDTYANFKAALAPIQKGLRPTFYDVTSMQLLECIPVCILPSFFNLDLQSLALSSSSNSLT